VTSKPTPSRDKSTALQRARERIVTLEEQVRLLETRSEVLRSAGIGTWEIDLARGKAAWDDSMEALLGLDEPSRGSLKAGLARVHPDDRRTAQRAFRSALRARGPFEVEFRICTHDRVRVFHYRGQVLSAADGRPTRATGVYWDVTDQRETERHVQDLAEHDPLTGLMNRRSFEEHVELARRRADRDGALVAVLCLDLDHFKQVNDGLGYRSGDELLNLAAERLAHAVRTGDPLARIGRMDGSLSRMGGDEFSLLLSSLREPEQAERVARRLLHSLAEPFLLEGQEIYLGASIGVALHPADGIDAATLLRNAETAMHAAKAEGGNDYRFFAESMNRVVRRRLHVERALRRALRDGELFVQYQPIVDAKTRRAVAVEALVRLRDGQGSLIGPDEFIPIAEDTGLILPLGEWALRQACRQAQAWGEAGSPVRLAVNLSSVQIARPGLRDLVAGVLQETGLAPERLALEITETAILRDRSLACEVLEGIRSLGVRIALDDFGTGYSSLTWLRRFPIASLKIDKSFIRDVASQSVDARLTEGIVHLAQGMGLTVVAEGVETSAQADRLSSFGCDALQGFLFARPMDSEDLEALLAAGGGPLPLNSQREPVRKAP